MKGFISEAIVRCSPAFQSGEWACLPWGRAKSKSVTLENGHDRTLRRRRGTQNRICPLKEMHL